MAGINPASAGAYAQYEAAKAAGRSSPRPSLEWFSDRHKRRTAERESRLAEARAARGPVGHEAVDAACERIQAASTAAAEAARNGGERADIARWNAEALARGAHDEPRCPDSHSGSAQRPACPAGRVEDLALVPQPRPGRTHQEAPPAGSA